MADRTIVIDVEVSQDDAAKKLAATKQEIARLKSEQRQLNDFIKNGADTTGELSKQYAANASRLKEMAALEKTYTAQLNAANSEQREYGDSINELKQKLTELKSIYRGLSEEQRQSAGGQELKKNIQALDEEVKGMNYSLGDFQENVGNYASALTGLDSRVVKVASTFGGGFKQGLKAAGNALKTFGKTLLATPLGWILAAIAAIVAIFNKLKEAFERNDDAATELSAAMKAFQPILTAINKVFSLLAEGVAKLVSGFAKVATTIIGAVIPSFKQASDAARELEYAQDRLEDKQRDYVVNSANRQLEIAKLNKKARGDESLTAKQREEIYQRIDDLEKADLEERKKIAEENLRIIKERYKNEVNESDAAKDEIAAATAELAKAEAEYYEGTTRAASRQAAAAREYAAELKKQHEDYVKRIKEQRKLVEETAKEVENLRISLIRNETERQRAEIRQSYKERIDAIKTRLKEEENLTKQSRANLNEQIRLLQVKMNEELAKVDEERMKAASDKEVEEFQRLADMRAAMLSERLQVGYSYDKEIAALKKRLEEEEDLTVNAKMAINEQIEILEAQKDEKLRELTKKAVIERINEEAAQRELAYRELVARAMGSENELAAAELAAATENYNALVALDAEARAAMFENDKEYEVAVLESQERIRVARENQSKAMQEQAQQTADTLHAVTSSMSDLFTAVAGDSAEYEAFRKTMAVVDATISLAETIAKATAISTEGDPYTVAIRIAAAVAAVTSQFASLIASLNSISIPSAPTFATGGIVPGTSYTGDNVAIRANSGEMIINAEQQRRLWEFVRTNTAGGDISAMREAFAQALREMPAPILDYSEFTGFQKRVKMVEKRIKLR